MCQPPVSSRPALVPELRPRGLSATRQRRGGSNTRRPPLPLSLCVSPPPPPPPPPIPSRPLHQPCANAYIVALLFAPRAASTTYCLHTVPAYCLRGPPCLRLRLRYSLFLARDSRERTATTPPINLTTGHCYATAWTSDLPYTTGRSIAETKRNETRRNP